MKDVTAAILRYNDRVLIAQRPEHDALAGKWEFPGGKREQGETLQQCLQREMKEEFDIDIEVMDFFGESIYEYDKGKIRLLAFWCRWISGELVVNVHSRIAWVHRDEWDKYDFAPADIPLVQKLKSIIH